MIKYKEIMSLNFKKEVASDSVHEEIYGYPYVLFYKKLSKHITIYWWQTSLTCEVMRSDKDHNVLNRIKITDSKELKLIMDLFGKKNRK